MDKLNLNQNYNDCKMLIYEYLRVSKMYTKINKKNCLTNSCRRRKEELIGCLKDLHESIEICE